VNARGIGYGGLFSAWFCDCFGGFFRGFGVTFHEDDIFEIGDSGAAFGEAVVEGWGVATGGDGIGFGIDGDDGDVAIGIGFAVVLPVEEHFADGVAVVAFRAEVNG